MELIILPVPQFIGSWWWRFFWYLWNASATHSTAVRRSMPHAIFLGLGPIARRFGHVVLSSFKKSTHVGGDCCGGFGPSPFSSPPLPSCTPVSWDSGLSAGRYGLVWSCCLEGGGCCGGSGRAVFLFGHGHSVLRCAQVFRWHVQGLEVGASLWCWPLRLSTPSSGLMSAVGVRRAWLAHGRRHQ